MASIAKIARRTFLIGSAAIVGGVAFGAYYISRPAPNPLQPGEGEAALGEVRSGRRRRLVGHRERGRGLLPLRARRTDAHRRAREPRDPGALPVALQVEDEVGVEAP